MLTTFTSSADADVMMFGEVASQILGLIGKDSHDVQGIITVEQLPAALARLQQAAEQDRRERRAAEASEQEDEDEEQVRARVGNISLSQRIVPLQAMLQRALHAQVPVIWCSAGSRE